MISRNLRALQESQQIGNYFKKPTYRNDYSLHHNHGKFWNCEERQYLIHATRMGVSPIIIARTLGRSRNSIAMKMVEMGL